MGLFSSPKTKVQVMDPFAGTGIRELYQQLNEMFTPMSKQLTPFTDQVVPGASPLQQSGFGAAQGLTPMAQGGQGYFQDIMGMTDPSAPGRYMGMAEQGAQSMMQPFDPSMAMKAMEPSRQFAKEFMMEDLLPAIMERLPMSGAKAGGNIGRQFAKEGARLSTGLGAQLGQMLFPAWQNQLGRQQTGVNQMMNMAQMPGQILGQAGQIGGMGTNWLNQLLGIGAQQRGITGEMMQEPYMKFQQPYSPQIMQLLQMGLGQPGKEIVGQQQPGGMGYSMLSGLAPGIGFGMGQAGLGSFGGGGVLGGLGNLAGGLGGIASGVGGAALGGLCADAPSGLRRQGRAGHPGG